MPYRSVYSPILWRHFLNWGSLLSDESSVCHTNIKLASTPPDTEKSKWQEICVFNRNPKKLLMSDCLKSTKWHKNFGTAATVTEGDKAPQWCWCKSGHCWTMRVMEVVLVKSAHAASVHSKVMLALFEVLPSVWLSWGFMPVIAALGDRGRKIRLHTCIFVNVENSDCIMSSRPA